MGCRTDASETLAHPLAMQSKPVARSPSSFAPTPITRPHVLFTSGLWSTSSLEMPPDMSPAEMSSLQQHLKRCGSVRGLLFRVHCTADVLADFLKARVITTLCLMTVSVFAVMAVALLDVHSQ